jgi:hypothetical protein
MIYPEIRKNWDFNAITLPLEMLVTFELKKLPVNSISVAKIILSM